MQPHCCINNLLFNNNIKTACLSLQDRFSDESLSCRYLYIQEFFRKFLSGGQDIFSGGGQRACSLRNFGWGQTTCSNAAPPPQTIDDMQTFIACTLLDQE